MKRIGRPFGQIKAITSRDTPKIKMKMKTLQESMEIIIIKLKGGAFAFEMKEPRQHQIRSNPKQ